MGLDGDVIGLDRFGASAPGPTVMKELGFSAENVAARAKAVLKQMTASVVTPGLRFEASGAPELKERSVVKLVISSDHAGFSLKEEVRAYLARPATK